MSNKGFVIYVNDTTKCEMKGVPMSSDELPDEITNERYIEIKDGCVVDSPKDFAKDLIMSNEEIYQNLRIMYVITIEVLPESVLNTCNTVRVHFEDIDKYIARLKARYGVEE